MSLLTRIFTQAQYEVNEYAPTVHSVVTCERKGPERVRASESQPILAVKGSRTVVLSHNALGIVSESFGLGQKVQPLEHFGI